ncbi:MAG: glutathione S-transferase family protein [Alphaproteobacteria bacterium]
MSLTLYFHPLSSFCHKVLIALYEHGTAFEGRIVDFMDAASRRQFLELWPVGKIPVLRDEANDRTIPETTIIVEYLEQHYPGAHKLLPEHRDERLEARLWDRFYDLYVHAPMQKLVADRLRPDGARDPHGVAEAAATIQTAYAIIDRHMADKIWATGAAFTIADCAAAPALFYAGIVAPFAGAHKNLAAYFDRLERRASFQRTIAGAKPYFHLFPLQDRIPARFR